MERLQRMREEEEQRRKGERWRRRKERNKLLSLYFEWQREGSVS